MYAGFSLPQSSVLQRATRALTQHTLSCTPSLLVQSSALTHSMLPPSKLLSTRTGTDSHAPEATPPSTARAAHSARWRRRWPLSASPAGARATQGRTRASPPRSRAQQGQLADSHADGAGRCAAARRSIIAGAAGRERLIAFRYPPLEKIGAVMRIQLRHRWLLLLAAMAAGCLPLVAPLRTAAAFAARAPAGVRTAAPRRRGLCMSGPRMPAGRIPTLDRSKIDTQADTQYYAAARCARLPLRMHATRAAVHNSHARVHARAHARAFVRAHTYTLHTIHRMCGMLAASLVTHADDKWIEQLKALYRARITPGAVVLDLMGSHIRQAPT